MYPLLPLYVLPSSQHSTTFSPPCCCLLVCLPGTRSLSSLFAGVPRLLCEPLCPRRLNAASAVRSSCWGIPDNYLKAAYNSLKSTAMSVKNRTVVQGQIAQRSTPGRGKYMDLTSRKGNPISGTDIPFKLTLDPALAFLPLVSLADGLKEAIVCRQGEEVRTW